MDCPASPQPAYGPRRPDLAVPLPHPGPRRQVRHYLRRDLRRPGRDRSEDSAADPSRTVMPRDGCAPHEQSAPTGCSSSANGTCDRYWVSTPAVTTATARTSPASNDHPTMTAKRARRWTCRSSGGRNTRSDAIRLFLKRYRHRRAGRAGTGVGTGLSPRRGSAGPYSGRRVAGQDGPVCHHEHAVKFWKWVASFWMRA